MKQFLSLLFAVIACNILQAQNVGIGTTAPNASAQLDVTSTNKGLLIPRMTGAQRIAIPSPAIGLLVIQTNTEIVPPSFPGLYLYEQVGAFPVWRRMARTDETTTTWTQTGADQYSNVGGNVGIGIQSPTSKFHLVGNLLQENGTMTINNTTPMLLFQTEGVNKGFLQAAGDNIRIATSSGNVAGRFIVRLNNIEPFVIEPSGNVGIGTSDPNYLLNVDGDARAVGDVRIENGFLNIYNTTDAINWNLQYSAGADRLLFLEQGVERLILRNGGEVGIGAVFTGYKLNVAGDVRALGDVRIENGFLNIYNTTDAINWNLQYSSGTDRLLFLEQGIERMVLRNGGNVGIGVTPTEKLQVGGNTLISSGGVLSLAKASGLVTVEIKPTESGADGASMLLYNNAGVATIEIDADFSDGDGRIITDELQINGGSDLAENFDINEAEENYLKPGMLVSIDTEKEGLLCITNQSTDKKIVGVISGANGIKPGMLMGQQGTIAYGKYPIALAGRVYVLCNEEGGEINAGDFLTSASQRGYAKKAGNLNDAQGAIIGKAMGKADPKTGYVLVLINLQ